MVSATARILKFAQDMGVKIEEVSNYAFQKKMKHFLSDSKSDESNMCQSDDMIQYMMKFGFYYHLHVRVWFATFENKIVGILMMSKSFNPNARSTGVRTDNFIPSHNNFITHSSDISDMLAICARGFRGLGKLLTLLALSESGPKGLFLQVQQIYTEKAETDPNDPNHLIFVRRASISDAAKVIYSKYGFNEIPVSDGTNILNILCYYRDSPLKDEECVGLLVNWEKSWTSRRNLAPLEEKKQQEEKIEEAAIDFDPFNSPQLDFGGGEYSFLDVPNEYDQHELFALDLNNGPDVILEQEFGDPTILAQGEQGENFEFDPLYGILPNEPEVLPQEQKIQSPPRKRGRPNKKPASGVYECATCHKTFTRSDNYQRHLKIHAAPTKESREFGCPRCDQRFHRKEDLENHMLRKHQKKREYPCPYCPYKAGNTSDLYKHMDVKHADKPRQKKSSK